MEDHLRDIIRLSLDSSPEKMMERALQACIDISGARGGSILGEEGPYLQFLFSDVPDLVGKRVPLESIAGATILKGVIIYTFAPKDSRHFKEIDDTLPSRTRYLLSIPIPSIHRSGEQQQKQKNAGALQLLFDENLFAGIAVDESLREFEVDAFREDEFCRKHLNGIFVILPNIAFAMEVTKLRQTSYQAIHELKNKLISALSWLDYLKSDIQPDPQAMLDRDAVEQDMELVESALREGAELAKTYLTLASLYEPHFTDCDLNAVLRDVGASAQAFGDLRRPGELRLDTDLNPALPVRRLDSEKLKMAFFNLCKNAVEAMLDHRVAEPCLTIVSRLENDRLVVTVGDNGPGMPKEIADNLFIPFKTKKEGGTGLGLTITKKIIDMHGGRIQCGTGADGTTFTVII
ncbi:MAG: HAMP domain-containing sensor histidine kinase [bacterium]